MLKSYGIELLVNVIVFITYTAPATFVQNIQINANIKNTKAIRERRNSVIMNKVNKVESCLIIEPDSPIFSVKRKSKEYTQHA